MVSLACPPAAATVAPLRKTDWKGKTMSIHRSFASGSGLSKHRSVLTRVERLERLKAEGRWEAGKKVTGLPKVRNIKVK
jgi:small basic protein (TIGR04137 family)